MSTEIKLAIKYIQTLIKARLIIQHDYSDCPDKEKAQKIINELIIAKAEDIADWYIDSKDV